MQVCKLSVCKEPTLYQSVHENVSQSLLNSLFLYKTIQLSPFDLQSTARCQPFYKMVTSIAFSMNDSIQSHVCNIDTMMLNFNGMIKWYDISCAILYIGDYIDVFGPLTYSHLREALIHRRYIWS